MSLFNLLVDSVLFVPKVIIIVADRTITEASLIVGKNVIDRYYKTERLVDNICELLDEYEGNVILKLPNGKYLSIELFNQPNNVVQFPRRQKAKLDKY